MSSRRNAFTLVELLIVIAIIAILSTVTFVVAGQMRSSANKTVCLSNQRQIGIAMMSYTTDNLGFFPVSTHSTGPFRKDKSWIFELAPYLGNIDDVRICPADSKTRQERIRKMRATSYLMNDLVVDSPQYNRVSNIPNPARTLLLFILSEDRPPSITRDHIHGAQWNSWRAALSDVEPDRHRSGNRAKNRDSGSANYLFADGHAENIQASEFKLRFTNGINPAAVPDN